MMRRLGGHTATLIGWDKEGSEYYVPLTLSSPVADYYKQVWCISVEDSVLIDKTAVACRVTSL